jgi:hypothetical protein
MCSALGAVLVLLVLSLVGIAAWIWYPAAWSFIFPTDAQSREMSWRSRKVGYRTWPTLGTATLLVAAIFGFRGC